MVGFEDIPRLIVLDYSTRDCATDILRLLHMELRRGEPRAPWGLTQPFLVALHHATLVLRDYAVATPLHRYVASIWGRVRGEMPRDESEAGEIIIRATGDALKCRDEGETLRWLSTTQIETPLARLVARVIETDISGHPSTGLGRALEEYLEAVSHRIRLLEGAMQDAELVDMYWLDLDLAPQITRLVGDRLSIQGYYLWRASEQLGTSPEELVKTRLG